MSRGKGTFNFAANLEPLLAGPIDARTVVGLYSDLIDPSTWKIKNGAVWGEAWVYTGMPVYVQSDPSKGLYVLTDSAAYNVYSSWLKMADTSSATYDLSSYATNASVGTALSYFIESSSIGTGFNWNAGMLDVSVAAGGGDVTKLYVDGSLATKVSKAGDTMTGNLTINAAAPKLFLTDTQDPFLTLGLASEVGGQLIDFGSNYHQLSTIDASYPGGYFRIDLRDAQASEFFGVHYVPIGGAETTPFKLSRTGDLVTDGSITTGGNLIVNSAEQYPLIINNYYRPGTPAYYGAIKLSGNGYDWGAIQTIQTNPTNAWTSRMAFSTMDGNDGALTERMAINNDGNVGIGTAAPNFTAANRTTLDINGTSTAILALSIGGTGKVQLYHEGTNLFVNNVANGDMVFQTNNVEKVRILAGGNVGIGIAAPDVPLHIYKSATSQLLFLQNGNDGAYIDFATFGASSTYPQGRVGVIDDGAYGGRLLFSTKPNGSATGVLAEWMRIQPDGKVGIGTADPATKLEVAGIVTARDYVQVLDTGGAEGFKMQWNDTEKSIDFIIN